MTSSSPAAACSRRVWSPGECWQATHLLLSLCEGGIFVERAMWFGLLDHRGRLVRMPASVCDAYDCSVCYVRCEATPERLAASGTADGSHPSVIVALWALWLESSFTEADIVGMLFSSGTLLCKDVRLLVSWYFAVGWNPLQNSPPGSCNFAVGHWPGASCLLRCHAIMKCVIVERMCQC